MDKCEKTIRLTRRFSRAMSQLELEYDGYIYNPLDYAWDMHEKFLEKAVTEEQHVLLLGMNPGPFGMCQNGVPFGDKVNVREYLKIDGVIRKPRKECPKRPIEGLDVKRVEMSGKRIWGTVSELWSAEEFFSFATVFNYCPLCFLDEGGRNVTPDKLTLGDRKRIYELCDRYLEDVISIIKPGILVGVGNFATDKLRHFGDDVRTLPHPSPLNRGSADFYGSEKAKEFFIGLRECQGICKGQHRT